MHIPVVFCRYSNCHQKEKKLTVWWPECSHDINCSTLSSTESMACIILRTGLKRMGKKQPWNWRLTELKTIKKTLRPLHDQFQHDCWTLLCCSTCSSQPHLCTSDTPLFQCGWDWFMYLFSWIPSGIRSVREGTLKLGLTLLLIIVRFYLLVKWVTIGMIQNDY